MGIEVTGVKTWILTQAWGILLTVMPQCPFTETFYLLYICLRANYFINNNLLPYKYTVDVSGAIKYSILDQNEVISVQAEFWWTYWALPLPYSIILKLHMGVTIHNGVLFVFSLYQGSPQELFPQSFHSPRIPRFCRWAEHTRSWGVKKIEDLINYLYMHPHNFSKMVLGRKFYKILQGTKEMFNFLHFHSLFAVI